MILDEIGRGTATWDGLAIAWACLEHLHNQNRCRTLFATHYHELTSLQSQLTRLEIYAMQVREWKGDIVFLHQVSAGAADKSYGVHVAKLTGFRLLSFIVPLHCSEAEAQSQNNYTTDMLPLFDMLQSESTTCLPTDQVTVSERLGEILDELEPDAFSPREALSLLYKLKAEYDKSNR